MTLDQLAIKYGSDKSSYSHKYTYFYDMFFNPIKDSNLKLLEIGIAQGASLRMWKEYFPTSLIYGIDHSPGCKQYEEQRISVFIGDQSNKEFLLQTLKTTGDLDIVIDDGSHVSYHQIASFEVLFPYVKKGGYYVIEDLHTSYLKEFQIKSPIPAIEYLKSKIDDVNMRGKSMHSNKKSAIIKLKEKKIPLTYYEETIESIFFSQGLCIIKKMV